MSFTCNFQLGVRISLPQGRFVRDVIQDDVTSRPPAQLVFDPCRKQIRVPDDFPYTKRMCLNDRN